MKRKWIAAVAALSIGGMGTANAKPERIPSPAPQTPPAQGVPSERPHSALADFGEAERTTAHVVGRLPFGLDAVEPASALYRAAQTHQREGRRDQARTLYQQVHLMTPTSWFGQQAMNQLQGLDGDFGSEESEEPPTPVFAPRGPSTPVRPQDGSTPSGF